MTNLIVPIFTIHYNTSHIIVIMYIYYDHLHVHVHYNTVIR